jgi:hypothetical protein
VIERQALGKEYAFSICIGRDFPGGLAELINRHFSQAEELPRSLPSNWPALATLHGTAGLLHVWEDLGVDPLQVRLATESFRHQREPLYDEELMGRLTVEDLHELTNPNAGVEQQVHLLVRLCDRSGQEVATYQCSYRIPIATWHPKPKRTR